MNTYKVKSDTEDPLIAKHKELVESAAEFLLGEDQDTIINVKTHNIPTLAEFKKMRKDLKKAVKRIEELEEYRNYFEDSIDRLWKHKKDT